MLKPVDPIKGSKKVLSSVVQPEILSAFMHICQVVAKVEHAAMRNLAALLKEHDELSRSDDTKRQQLKYERLRCQFTQRV